MFHKMDDHWPRQEHFRHYMDTVRCTYSLTVNIDVTQLCGVLKTNNMKAYPAHIYMLASVVNQMPEFRMGLSKQGDPGYWDIMHPSYTIFNAQTNTFSSIWTPFVQDFSEFYQGYVADINEYAESSAFAPKQGEPPNVFTVSSIPWVDFTAFNLNVYSDGTYLAPIFTIGKYIQQNDKTLMPLAMQIHHAACDGYHVGQFIETLRTLAQDYRSWLKE